MLWTWIQFIQLKPGGPRLPTNIKEVPSNQNKSNHTEKTIKTKCSNKNSSGSSNTSQLQKTNKTEAWKF